MIDLTRGNILQADAEALVNTVNCVGVMGKGIALQFKNAFPDNFKAYERACRNDEVRLGQMFIVPSVVVSLTMIGAGCVMLRETEHERPLQARWYHWTGIVAGGLIVIWSFCKDYDQTLAGEMPNAYSWPLFALGELVGMAAFAHALRQGRTRVAPR